MKTLLTLGLTVVSACVAFSGGSTAAAGTAGCSADLNGDGLVDAADLGLMLASWDESGRADLDGSGTVGGEDLGLLLGSWNTTCSFATRVELAGRPLNTYPYFEHTRSFNAGFSVWIGIDPNRFPSVAGASALVWVVSSRSEAEWQRTTDLVDVRPSGPQEVTFGVGTIQACSFSVDGGTLDGNGGLDISIGYDVVIDLNSNGQLDGGDLLDGAGGLDGTEAGFFVVRDLTLPGPYSVTTKTWSVTGVTGGFSSEKVYYPSNIADLAQLPLVVVSHGNGHQYTWYDYIGNHLASYGYIVMSHQNNTGPGTVQASTTTLQHTQAIIAQQTTLGGGVLNGHLDSHTIIWIGHSRGGEGVVRAYDRILDGNFVPTNYTLADIKLISSIAPTDFLNGYAVDPHFVPYHLVYGSSDGDVCGCPDNDVADSFNIYERADGIRQSMYLHGASHNDFHSGSVFEAASGPDQLSKTETQTPAKAMWLALVKYYIEGQVAAKDYFWRQYEVLRPQGVATKVVAVLDYHDGPDAGSLEIDDLQSNSATNLSSIGGLVTYDVTNLVENKMNDANTAFTWTASDAMNGMVRGRTGDTQRCIVFDWDGPHQLEFELPGGTNDLSDFRYLQFRATQGTRHPNTTAVLENLTFLVTLRDGDGSESTINFGAYGGGIQEPYQRTGFGTGAGWQNEFEVIRVRLADFLNNGSSLDLTNITSIRFDFAQPGTSAKGRIGFDDLRLTTD